MKHLGTIEYSVACKDGDVELRDYEDFTIIKYESVMDKQADNGFQLLYSYFSGNNEKKEKISMGVPVITQLKEKQRAMAFFTSTEYDTKDIPKPILRDLSIENFKSGKYAVIRFRGKATDEKIKQYKEKLYLWIKSMDFVICSDFMVFIYNSPHSLRLRRKNEIIIKVDNKGIC